MKVNDLDLDSSLAGRLIGKTMEEAEKEITPLLIRARTIDGKPQMVTADHKKNRVNVSLKNGKIVDVVGMG